MDNTQVMARDGSWFLFGDWQGVTRIALPGDRVKTDSGLDRPRERMPFVVRDDGLVWFQYAVDLDPAALKKVRRDVSGHGSPDPLGGPELLVGYDGAVHVRGRDLPCVPDGDVLSLGGVGARRQQYADVEYQVFVDGALVVFGTLERTPTVAYVVRDPDGAGRVAWCRRVARVPNGAPDAFRRAGSLLLVDRDIVDCVAHLAEIREDGTVVTASTAAVAGPWFHDGLVWWQPDEGTLCAGAELGRPSEHHVLPAEHAGAGRLLRLPGRKLYLPWHGVTMLDLAPAKKGKSEISRKHKAADEPLYRSASQLLRPISEAMARRNVRVSWSGVVRRGKRIEPEVDITGTSELITYLLHYSLQDGAAAALARYGVTSVSVMGGAALDELIRPAALTTAGDIRYLITALDASGVNRATGFAYLHSLSQWAAQRDLGLPWTPEAELFAVAATLSGIRGETGTIAPATAEALAAVVPRLADWEEMRKAGISSSGVAQFLAVSGHRRFGAEAVAPLMKLLESFNPTYPAEVLKTLGLPFTPYVAPVEPEVPLTAEESIVVDALESVLRETFGVDAVASREGRGWYRFVIDGLPFQAGLNDEGLVIGTLCATDTDVDLRKLVASLKRANKGRTLARFVEADCYIHARASAPFAGAGAPMWKAMIEACRDALRSEAGQALAAEYRTME